MNESYSKNAGDWEIVGQSSTTSTNNNNNNNSNNNNNTNNTTTPTTPTTLTLINVGYCGIVPRHVLVRKKTRYHVAEAQLPASEVEL